MCLQPAMLMSVRILLRLVGSWNMLGLPISCISYRCKQVLDKEEN